MQAKDAVSCWKEQGVSVEASQHDNQIYCIAHGRALSLQHSLCLVKAARQLHRRTHMEPGKQYGFSSAPMLT